MDDMTAETVIDNEGIADDYFSAYQEVDGEGNAVQADDTQPQQGNQQANEQVGNQDKPQKSDQPEAPVGFVARFNKTDDKGNQMFDSEGAHQFLMGGSDYAYQGSTHVQDPSRQPQAQQAPAAQQGQQEVEPWRKPILERQEYEKNLFDQMTLATRVLRERIGDGLKSDPNTQQLLDYQDSLVRQHIRDELLPKWEWERRVQQEKERNEEMERTAKDRDYQQKAQVNISSMASKMGGQDVFNEFFFGTTVKTPDGKSKHVPGPATDAVYHLFDLQNPDKLNLSGNEYRNAMQDWWNRFASNEANLQLLYQFGVARFQRQHWDKLTDVIRAAGTRNAATQKRAGTPAPSANASTQSTTQSGTGHPELDRYLTGREMTETETI